MPIWEMSVVAMAAAAVVVAVVAAAVAVAADLAAVVVAVVAAVVAVVTDPAHSECRFAPARSPCGRSRGQHLG